jgi:F-type H+-transporting ATPase subunit a
MLSESMFLLASDNPTDHVTDKVLISAADGTPLLTMHMVTITVVAAAFVAFMMRAAAQIATGPESAGNERYLARGRFGQVIEAMVVYLRREMLLPVLGEEHTRRYLPFLMTVFFFILFQNLFGLLPVLDLLQLAGAPEPAIGGTATANIMVTGALALISFVVIQIHGIRELGIRGWVMHNFAGLMPGPVYLLPVALLVFVVELLGHLIKPAALAIRLFANMVAGHTLMAVLVGFGASAARGGMGALGWTGISLVSGIAGVLVTFLEVFVAFLQAFIFMFLTAVFISLLSHHGEEHEHQQEAHTPAGAHPAAT